LLAEQQPSDYQLASGDLVSSPLAAALDPRVDEQLVKEQMLDEPAVEKPDTQAAEHTDTDVELTVANNEDMPETTSDGELSEQTQLADTAPETMVTDTAPSAVPKTGDDDTSTLERAAQAQHKQPGS